MKSSKNYRHCQKPYIPLWPLQLIPSSSVIYVNLAQSFIFLQTLKTPANYEITSLKVCHNSMQWNYHGCVCHNHHIYTMSSRYRTVTTFMSFIQIKFLTVSTYHGALSHPLWFQIHIRAGLKTLSIRPMGGHHAVQGGSTGTEALFLIVHETCCISTC